MRTLIFLFLLSLVSTVAHASWETYLKEFPDGSVGIVYYKAGSRVPVQDLLESANEAGDLPVDAIQIQASDFPVDRTDRKYWKKSLIGKKIKIDTAQKQADQDAKDAEKLAKKGILSKLCNSCTDQEWEEIGLL